MTRSKAGQGTRRRRTGRALAGTAATALVAVAALAGGADGRAGAQVDDQTTVAVPFGMVGITAAQTARLSVVAVAVPPNPCVVVLRFVDAEGQVLALPGPLAAPVEQTATLERAGQSAFLDLPGASVVPSSALRTQLRASVTYPPNPCAGVVSSLELFDQAGVTSVFLAPGPPD